jgi:hypothetical protein
MASSPADRADALVGADGPVAFALLELRACWQQALAALEQGDVDAAGALLDVAQDHVAAAGDGARDTATEAQLRTDALAAHARLEHGVRVGIDGLAAELGRVRAGGKALRGYGRASLRIDGAIDRDA